MAIFLWHFYEELPDRPISVITIDTRDLPIA